VNLGIFTVVAILEFRRPAVTISMREQDDPPPAFHDGTRLQLESADLLRQAAELHHRTALARQRFEAIQRRVLDLKRRFKLIGWHPSNDD